MCFKKQYTITSWAVEMLHKPWDTVEPVYKMIAQQNCVCGNVCYKGSEVRAGKDVLVGNACFLMLCGAMQICLSFPGEGETRD